MEHVETTGDARCRLQWRLGTAGFSNISQTNQFTHTLAATYGFTKLTTTTGTATVVFAGLVGGGEAPAGAKLEVLAELVDGR